MKLTIDTDTQTLSVEDASDLEAKTFSLYSDAAFRLLSDQWLKVGWNQKYPYTFSWLGRPVIQLPEDLIRVQEAIYTLQPDVIVETGVAHGGSLIFYATLCHAMNRGIVIGVDIEIRPHNRSAIEAHPLAPYIRLIEGSSTDAAVLQQVKSLIPSGARVMAILDSNHSRQHVAAELRAYADIVTPGSYMLATDGIMRDLADVPRGRAEWRTDNPAQAALEFLEENTQFIEAPPPWQFNESTLRENITGFPNGWLKKIT